MGFTNYDTYSACIDAGRAYIYVSFWDNPGTPRWEDREIRLELMAVCELSRIHDVVQFSNLMQAVVDPADMEDDNADEDDEEEDEENEDLPFGWKEVQKWRGEVTRMNKLNFVLDL